MNAFKESDSSDDGGVPPGQVGSGPANASRQRQHVTIACLRCRFDKAKCEGTQPCGRCAARNQDCVYSTTRDGRSSRLHLKRRLDGAERENAILHHLVNNIRNSTDTQVAQIIAVVRSRASLAEIQLCLSQMADETAAHQQKVDLGFEIAPATTSDRLSSVDSSSGDKASREMSISTNRPALSIDRLIDEPSFRVPASPWTTVTNDDHLVSHLISVWTMWEHPWPDGIVLELFLRDMRSQDDASLFCSSFLVEAIVATACLFSDYDEARTRSGRQSEVADRFLENCEAHVRHEGGLIPTITNVQGLLVYFNLLTKIGRDRQGLQLCIQATYLCGELMRKRSWYLEQQTKEVSRQELSYTLDVLCWSTFSSTGASLIGLARPQPMPLPERPFPETKDMPKHINQWQWFPYPSRGPGRSPLMHESARHHADLAILIRELSQLLFASSEDTELDKNSLQALFSLEARLNFWHDQLPYDFKQVEVMPITILFLRWWWLAIVMTTLSALKTNLSRQLEQATGHDPNRRTSSALSIGSKSPQITHHRLHEVQTRLERAAVEAARFSEVFRTRFRDDRLSVFMCHPTHQAMYVLLFCNSEHKYDAEITQLCVTLRMQSRRIPFVVSLFRMIELDATNDGVTLPSAVKKLFEDFDQDDNERWKREPHHAIYPNLRPTGVGAANDGNADHSTEMGKFLKAFDNLEMRGKRPSE